MSSHTVVMAFLSLVSSVLAAVCQFTTLVQTEICEQLSDGHLNPFDQTVKE